MSGLRRDQFILESMKFHLPALSSCVIKTALAFQLRVSTKHQIFLGTVLKVTADHFSILRMAFQLVKL